MYIKIKKASKETFWYSDKIGECFHVTEIEDKPLDFKVNSHIHSGFEGKYLGKNDVEVISFLGKMVRVIADDPERKRVQKGMEGYVFKDADSDGDVKLSFSKTSDWHYVSVKYLEVIKPLSVRIGDVDVVAGNVVTFDNTGAYGMVLESLSYNKNKRELIVIYVSSRGVIGGQDCLESVKNTVIGVYGGIEHHRANFKPENHLSSVLWEKEKFVKLDGEIYTQKFFDRLKKEFENA